MDAVGLAKDGGFPLLLTQQDLSDALGLTTVHLNRMLQDLRDSGMVTVKRGHAVVHDPERLRRLAGFSPAYLHLDERARLCPKASLQLVDVPRLAVRKRWP